MKPFITREYNSVSYNHNFLTKTSTNPKIKDEIGYLLDIHTTDLAKYFPIVYGFSDKEVDMEYYDYPNIHEYITNTSNPNFSKLIETIQHFLKDAIKNKLELNHSTCLLTEMLITKTEKEYKTLIEQNIYFQNLCKDEYIYINGKKYLNFNSIWPEIKNKLNKYIHEALKTELPSIIHGDFCFSNMLISPNRFHLKLIDPRGSFGSLKGVYGYPIYDYAKLAHSILGKYELIINDLFKLQHDLNSIEFSFDKEISKKYDAIQQYIAFSGEQLLVMATIFIGMCARHKDSLERQIIMYSTGIKYLNEYL